MYYPYFRGKQYELLAVRESAGLMADASFVPVIEPVRRSLDGLGRALDAVSDAGGQAIVIVNPRHGQLSANGADITTFLDDNYGDNDAISAGVLLHSGVTAERATQLVDAHTAHGPALIHAGFTAPRQLAESLAEGSSTLTHLFIDDQASSLYRRHFDGGTRVLLRDGFEQMKNADYRPVDPFSELHVTFAESGMDGHGDFLTVGDRFTEGGGPAYAVAIHLSYIDPDNDDAMYIYHFVSDSNDTPSDAAGKFEEALAKVVAAFDDDDSKLLETSAAGEFRSLHARRHYPGLGYVKKLSMKHHIETLADYHSS
ncbi:sce7725 family protein [Microbacterium sp. NPDC087589]|uniref:sce7725 family protein n=1 Tax=Microbacterium sp. NPDC087589 TaxID=3364191 RepID=UPI003803F45B